MDIQQLIRRFNLSVRLIEGVEDSHSSTVYKCTLLRGEVVYIKIPYTKIKFEREQEAYRILHNRVKTPQLLDSWAGDEKCPGALLLSSIEGTPLSGVETSPEIAFDVGVLHGSMHNVLLTNEMQLQSIQDKFEQWSSFYEQMFLGFAEDVKKVIEPDIVEMAIQQYRTMRSNLPIAEGPSFVHMDFRPANIIVSNGEVSGVIDFESVRFGATEADFTKIYRDFLSLDEKLEASYKEGYNSVRTLIDLEAVLPYYRFADSFNSIGWCVRRGIVGNQKFFDGNKQLFYKLLHT